MKARPHLLLFAALSIACTGREPLHPPEGSTPDPSVSVAPAPPKRVVLSIVGTNDLHGRVQALPWLAGYVDNLRAVRREGGGGVLLLDAGDMFQGTLESNLLEGSPVRDAYGVLGYAAVAVGNHEFDYGPVGPAATPASPSDDPRGALEALAKAAPFPFLMGNLRVKATGARLDYPNMPASVIVESAGVRVGVVGVTTEKTLETTISSNVQDLAVEPLAAAIAREAASLRQEGARAVVVLAHAGSKCKHFTNDLAKDGCDANEEIFNVVHALPKNAVDAIVAGHTHAGVAHDIDGVPVIEQFAYGRSFGRVDLVFEGDEGAPTGHTIFPPRDICKGEGRPDFDHCEPGDYEGKPVNRSEAVARAIAPGIDIARDKRSSLVGVVLDAPFPKDYHFESPLGNLYADLIRDSNPEGSVPKRTVVVGLMNGGGLREDLPAGPLTYGRYFESFPFDNRVATARVKAGDLKRIVAAHLQSDGGVLSFSGVRVSAVCKDGSVDVTLTSEPGNKPIKDEAEVLIVASDFMLLGGDGFWGPVPKPSVVVGDALLRDLMEARLRQKKSVKALDSFDPKKPRLSLQRPRPMRCAESKR